MLCFKNRITLIGFLGQHADTVPQRTAPSILAFYRNQRELESEGNRGIQHTPGVASSHQLEQAERLGRPPSKGTYVELEGELRYRGFTPRNPIAVFALPRSISA